MFTSNPMSTKCKLSKTKYYEFIILEQMYFNITHIFIDM